MPESSGKREKRPFPAKAVERASKRGTLVRHEQADSAGEHACTAQRCDGLMHALPGLCSFVRAQHENVGLTWPGCENHAFG